MPRRLAALILVLSVACKGADGAIGPQGSAGPQGLQGPQGIPGVGANVATFTGVATLSGIDIPLPATVRANNLPTFTCYLALTAAGPWLVVPTNGATSTSPFCGLVIRTDGVVEIRLRNWIVGWSYYVTAAWR